MSDSARRVMIVDDDAGFASLVAEVLQGRGHQARAESDPWAALHSVQPGTLDVAVLDLHMPGLPGLELADKIRDQDDDVQFLVLTGLGDKETAIAGLQRGVFDYLEKADLDMDRLDMVVRAAAERCRLLRANREMAAQIAESQQLMGALLDMSAALVRQPHGDSALGELAGVARRLTQADEARAVLVDRTAGGGWVVTTAAGDGAEPLRGMRLRPGEGLFTLALDEGRPVLVADAPAHPRYSARADAFRTTRSGFLAAPVQHGELAGVVCVAGAAETGFSAAHADALGRLGRLGGVGIENALHHERALNFFTHTSEILVSFLDSRDVYLAGHSRAVARLGDLLSRRLGLREDERRRVHFAALLHDIGKVRLAEDLLHRDVLTAEDRKEMERHPAFGLEILRPISLWEDVLPMVHGHHERWDGKGYPLGLAGEDIPLGARIIAVADVFDALTRAPWAKPTHAPAQALTTMESLAGSQLDPRLVRLLVSELRQKPELLSQ